MPAFFTYILHVLEVLGRAIKTEIGMEAAKLSVYRWHDFLCKKPGRVHQKTIMTNYEIQQV